jgi:hypothetical protein
MSAPFGRVNIRDAKDPRETQLHAQSHSKAGVSPAARRLAPKWVAGAKGNVCATRVRKPNTCVTLAACGGAYAQSPSDPRMEDVSIVGETP